MARDPKKNLQLSISVEYDVYNWKLWEAQVQENIDTTLTKYGEAVVEQAKRLVEPPDNIGPGPHPHGRDDNDKRRHGFVWEDTGKLAEAVHYRLVTRGFLRTVEIYVDPIQIDGRIVDYGTFLEVGWHPVVPTKQGMKVTGNFYAYPWLSLSLAYANKRILAGIATELKKGLPQFHVFGKARSAGGTGTKVQANKFKISENITSAVDTFTSRAPSHEERITGWLKPSFKEPISSVRSKMVQKSFGKKP